jgi:hypothetical protein
MGGSVENDPGCAKTLRGIIAPGILGSVVMRRAKNGKICLPLGATTKSDFVFAQPRPGADLDRMLFDDLVGALYGCFRNSETERLGGLEVKGELEQGWLLDR